MRWNEFVWSLHILLIHGHFAVRNVTRDRKQVAAQQVLSIHCIVAQQLLWHVQVDSDWFVRHNGRQIADVESCCTVAYVWRHTCNFTCWPHCILSGLHVCVSDHVGGCASLAYLWRHVSDHVRAVHLQLLGAALQPHVHLPRLGDRLRLGARLLVGRHDSRRRRLPSPHHAGHARAGTTPAIRLLDWVCWQLLCSGCGWCWPISDMSID